MRLSKSLCACIGLVSFFSFRAAVASDVVVAVTGLDGETGEIACALFSNADGFPLEFAHAQLRRGPTRLSGEACRFSGLKPGPYAVAVARLARGQPTVDTDFLGRPREPWGVSDNIRPALRAPHFDEAAFAVPASGEVKLEVRLSR